MPRKEVTPDQVAVVFRQIEVSIGQGRSTPIACQEAGVSDASIPPAQGVRGLQVDEATRVMDLEKQNARLRKIVADLSPGKAMLKEVVSGNF